MGGRIVVSNLSLVTVMLPSFVSRLVNDVLFVLAETIAYEMLNISTIIFFHTLSKFATKYERTPKISENCCKLTVKAIQAQPCLQSHESNHSKSKIDMRIS